MTLKEFFRKARTRKWRVVHVGAWGYVRCADGYCPLAAVLGPDNLSFGAKLCIPSDAAKVLKIAPRDAQKIARAADSQKSKHRGWLLKNLGVSHTPTPEPPREPTVAREQSL